MLVVLVKVTYYMFRIVELYHKMTMKAMKEWGGNDHVVHPDDCMVGLETTLKTFFSTLLKKVLNE